MTRRILWAACALMLIVAGAGIWFATSVRAPLAIPESGVAFEVVKGSTLTSVANDLATDGVLANPRRLAWYGRLTGQAAQIKAGEYQLEPGSTGVSLLQQLVDGRVRLHTLTILEGWTVLELLDALGNHPHIKQTLAVDTPEGLATELNLNYSHAEGWFFPDTYRFPRGTTDTELLRLAHDLMQKNLTAAWATRAGDTPFADPYDALILASIVERESALDDERPRIAGVFIRRLEKNMRLQTDPTVIYGIGAGFDGNITRTHLETDTPYNTYVRRGLPPTPIALPGNSSLRAAVNPDAGDALYFVATGRGDGSHYFSETLEEHNAAVARYLAEMRRRRNE